MCYENTRRKVEKSSKKRKEEKNFSENTDLNLLNLLKNINLHNQKVQWLLKSLNTKKIYIQTYRNKKSKDKEKNQS